MADSCVQQTDYTVTKHCYAFDECGKHRMVSYDIVRFNVPLDTRLFILTGAKMWFKPNQTQNVIF